ncbi:MAG TPA: lysylphosphatidylglycerol synthase transmembrane domain-containing protein [Polyangiaceae bacterium]|nr:lysylphosphatidylglycerol synthase transmembrane domain-containing protein [Polyangiaceae bacterium]
MSSNDAPARPPRNRIWHKLLLSLVPAAALVWLMQSGSLPIVPRREELGRVASWTVPAYVGVWSISYFFRLIRWWFLLAAVEVLPLWTVVRAGAVGLFAIALLPFRMGEVVRPLLIRRPPRLTFWAASGTVGAERVLDALSVSVLLLVGLRFAKPLDKLPDHIGTLPIHVAIVPGLALTCALVFASGCVVMGVFYFWRDFARRLTERVVGLVSLPLARWLAAKIEQMAQGLGFLARPRQAVPFMLLTLAYWGLNAVGFWLLAVGCGIDIGFFGATATMGVVALGIIVPATPGFFGAFQLAIYAGLAMYLPPDAVTDAGSVYAFLGYVLPIGLTMFVGVLGVLAKPRALLALTGEPEQLAPSASENLAR